VDNSIFTRQCTILSPILSNITTVSAWRPTENAPSYDRRFYLQYC
jgi:hypothetical protein